MLKQPQHLLVLTCLSLIAVSCSDDDTDSVQPSSQPPPSVEPIILGCSDLTVDSVLTDRGSGVDYIWPCFIDIDANLKIEPGVTIEFEQGAGMEVNGSLEAIGTAGDSIIFTGVNKTQGAWRNIIFNSDDLNNNFQFCKIEYAGATDGSRSALVLDVNSKLILRNTLFTKNKAKGLFVSRSGNMEGYAENEFRNNNDYPMQIAAGRVKFLDGTSSKYIGNAKNQIYVDSDNLFERGYINGQEIQEWFDPGVPFFVNELVYVGETEFGHLRINEGCQLIFGNEYGFWVNQDNSIIEVLGTQGNEVTFEGQSGSGSWKGIFVNTNSTQNIIKHATISEGGQSKWRGSHINSANLSLGSSNTTVSLVLQDVSLTKSAGCGIVEESTVNLTETNVSFSQNAGADRCN